MQEQFSKLLPDQSYDQNYDQILVCSTCFACCTIARTS